MASSRLPWHAAVGAGSGPAPAGEAAATLRPWFDRSRALWVGWPGGSAGLDSERRRELDQQLAAIRMVPVHLDAAEVDRFIHGFSNRLLWPLFHYLLDRVPVDAHGWQAYQSVNARFADAIVGLYQDGDRIWVHDYQLLLLPGLLRQRLPDARIGFFLHVPFPSSEVFRTLPWRSALLKGLLGADLIGFQTFSHLRHFFSSILHVEHIEMDIDRVRIDGRDVRLGVFPMGVDAEPLGVAADAQEVLDSVALIHRDSGGRALGLALDRLDHTTGIPRRLEALERLMTGQADLRDRLRVFQVAVPLAEQSDAHRRLRREVEERIGRINGAYSTVRSVPVHYVHQRMPFSQVLALYRAADLMFVTPLRDGMSLAAKEFVATRTDGDGLLILSEFAGAADELDGALMVNPYDVEAMAATIARALTMPVDERRERMRTLRRRVSTWDVNTWAARFLESLATSRPSRPSPAEDSSALMRALAVAREGDIRLMLDYDGTLVPFAHLPELAAPDPALLELLERLLQLEGVRIDIVSGRARESLDEWFGHLPLALWAEHGFWWRLERGRPWACGVDLHPGWVDRVQPILDQFTANTPGSSIELKSASIAWHYRNAPEEFGARQAHELRLLLTSALSNQPFEVLEGKRVIEVRLRGVSKAVVARSLRTQTAGTVVAFGDDHTDEDLFRALPPGSITVGVGERPTRARFTARDFVEVRQILHALTRIRRGQTPGDTP